MRTKKGGASSNSVVAAAPAPAAPVVAAPANYNMVILAIIGVIVLAGVGYFGYQYLNRFKVNVNKTKTFIPYIHAADQSKEYSHGSLPVSASKYNYNLWVYVDDYGIRNGDDKCILFKGDKGTLKMNDVNAVHGNPSVWLLKHNNTLRVNISNDNGESDTCDVAKFPLQRWVNLNLSLNGNVIDIYLDGHLAKSCVLAGPIKINKERLYVCPDGGFSGFIANLKISNDALSSSKILDLYKKGPVLKPGLLG
jgi:hypothetical protein